MAFSISKPPTRIAPNYIRALFSAEFIIENSNNINNERHETPRKNVWDRAEPPYVVFLKQKPNKRSDVLLATCFILSIRLVPGVNLTS